MNESNISLANLGSNSSSVTTYCKYWEPESDAEKIAKLTVYVLTVGVGISLNIFVIILAAKFTVRRNFHHLIINMAVSDALFIFVELLVRVSWLSDYKRSIYPSGTLGLVICKTLIFLVNISYAVSLITLLVISIERFRATTITLQRRRHYTLKQRVLIFGVCWLIPMPAAGYFTYAAAISDQGACTLPYWLSDVRVPFIIIYILLIILCCVIVVLSILTIRRLSKPQAIQANLSEEQQSIRKRRTLAAVRMVLVSVFVYACCWIPSYVFNILITNIDIRVLCIDWVSLSFIINGFLHVVNSCFSPCIYIIFLPDFRQAAKKVLCRRNTLNQAQNRRNSMELQPMANPVIKNRRRRHYEEQEI